MTDPLCPPILGLDITEGGTTAAFHKGDSVCILLFNGRPFHYINELPDPAYAFAIIRRALAEEGLTDLKFTTLAVPLHWSQAQWQVLIYAAQRAGMGNIRTMTTTSAVALSHLYWRRVGGDQDHAIFDLRDDQVGWGIYRQHEDMVETLSLHYHKGIFPLDVELMEHKERLSAIPHIVLLARMGEADDWESTARQNLNVDHGPFLTMRSGGSAYLSASGAFIQSAILVGMVKHRFILDTTSYSYRLMVKQIMAWPVCPACGPRDTPIQMNCSFCGKQTENTTVFIPHRGFLPCHHRENLITLGTTIPTMKYCTLLATPEEEQVAIEGVGMDGQVFTNRVVQLPGNGTRLINLAIEVGAGHEQTISATHYGQTKKDFLPVFPAPPPKPPLGPVRFPHPGVQIHRDEFLKFPMETAPIPRSPILSMEELDAIMVALENGSIDLNELMEN